MATQVDTWPTSNAENMYPRYLVELCVSCVTLTRSPGPAGAAAPYPIATLARTASEHTTRALRGVQARDREL